MPTLQRLASSILLAALTASAAAQAPHLDADPFDALKAVAKAKFEAMRRTPAERAQALAETARMGWQERLREYRAGTIPPYMFWQWSPLVLEAQLGLLDKDADPAPLYERRWWLTRQMENIADKKLREGKIATADAAEVRWQRLDAELAWLRHRGVGKKTPNGLSLFAEFGSQDAADDEAKAVEADPRQLASERLNAARLMLAATMQEFQAGKITPDLLLRSVKRVFDSELALLYKGADPTPLLEWRRKTLWPIERVVAVKIEVGTIGDAEVAQCRSVLLDAEIAWLQAWKKKENRGDWKRIATDEVGVDDADWAMVKEKASRADVGKLLRDHLQTASEEYHGQRRDFQMGRITPGLALAASLGLLDAERAVASGPKEEGVEVERYWRRGLDLEAQAELKLKYGKIAIADAAEVRYARLQAEIWMETGLPMERRGPESNLR
jgi:hypothetical protein